VLLLVRLEELLPDFLEDFPSRPPVEWAKRIDDAAGDIGALAKRLEQTCAAQIIVQSVTLARDGYFGIHDAQRPDGQSQLTNRFNQRLAERLSERTSSFLWDFDALVRREGYATIFDPKAWYTSKSPYKQSAYPLIVHDLMRFVRSAFGRVKKCIVVDLDNTLWGGVVGEEGFDGIHLGQTYPGNCYRDFQRELLKLHHRGILLAINSKNNEADALQIIDHHPGMILRREHFAAMRINWRDKASNLRELAAELNLGVDSCIMLDDNVVECELLRRECPESDVVLLPDKPYLLPAVPPRLVGVENIRLTEEDRSRGAMYRARAERQTHEARYTDLDEFLRSLDIEASIEQATSFSIPRIAQLTQKTNQLNMTTRRYTEAQIQGFTTDPCSAVYAVSSRDRFGDDGIIGVFILRFADEACRIDTFLLSCRVIGRGIEQLMIAAIADIARLRGMRVLVGEYIPTAKNQPAAGLFDRLGFVPSGETLFQCELDTVSLVPPAYIRVATKAAMAMASHD
jgi:FkbH-like protein